MPRLYRVLFSTLPALLAAVAIAAVLLAYPARSEAEGDRFRFIRDAEIEHYLRSLASPIYRAAGIDPDSVHISIIENPAVNAFVAEGMNEFFFTGLLQSTDTPEQLAGVIAHETGHITGGHLVRGREAMDNASAEAILGMIIGMAAGVATGNGQAAAAILGASQDMAQRGILGFSRTQESAADAAALSFMDRAGVSSQGMLDFMKKLGTQEASLAGRRTEYARTHPLTIDRIDTVRHHLEKAAAKSSDLDASIHSQHERMKAKLLGYLQPEVALLRYTDRDARIPARYARAIALYRTRKLDRAVGLMEGLLKEEPDNPFFHELKAQTLFENGRVAEAVEEYAKAVALLPDSPLLLTAYGHALLEKSGGGGKSDPALVEKAIEQLEKSTRREPRDSETWRLLAAAWGKKAEAAGTSEADGAGRKYAGLATYALAEEAAARGNRKSASQLAERAMKQLAKGSPYWLRAHDIKLEGEGLEEK